MNAPPTRRRGEARAVILDHARQAFGHRGYDGTTMRDVATAAQVSEALLYRYFPSKGDLFSEAVVEPFEVFVGRFLSDWERQATPRSNDEMVRRFVTGLYDFVLEHRQLVFALVAAHRFGDPGAQEPAPLSQGIKRLAAFTGREAAQRRLDHVDIEMAVTCTIGMVVSLGVLDDLLFEGGPPDRSRIVAGMTAYAAAGIQQRSELNA